MSVLASVVINRINTLFLDTSNGKWSELVKLEAVNYAIDNAWPHIRRISVDTSQTLAAATYEYAPSATPEVETGYAQAYAMTDGYSDVLLRAVSQSLNGTTWTIHAGRDAADYSGYGLKLVYTARIPRVTTTTDPIELPLDYLFKAAAVALMGSKMLQESSADVGAYEKMLVKYERDVQQALIQNQRGPIAHSIPIIQDGGYNTERLTSGYHS